MSMPAGPAQQSLPLPLRHFPPSPPSSPTITTPTPKPCDFPPRNLTRHFAGPRRPSPNTAARENATLSVNLSSNNPFRNRAVSPGLSSSSPRSFDTADHRMSRNPFLDAGDFAPAAPPSKEVNGLTADIFVSEPFPVLLRVIGKYC